MSQQEDDLRALAKIMDFLRAVSIILVVVHLYWYGYEAVRLWGIDIGVVDAPPDCSTISFTQNFLRCCYWLSLAWVQRA